MMQDLHNVSHGNHYKRFQSTYSKPMCEWTTKRAQRIESVSGFRDPAAKGAMVKGIRPAETILSKLQW